MLEGLGRAQLSQLYHDLVGPWYLGPSIHPSFVGKVLTFNWSGRALLKVVKAFSAAVLSWRLACDLWSRWRKLLHVCYQRPARARPTSNFSCNEGAKLMSLNPVLSHTSYQRRQFLFSIGDAAPSARESRRLGVRYGQACYLDAEKCLYMFTEEVYFSRFWDLNDTFLFANN